MYTVEFEHDEVTMTILDDNGDCPDLIINAFDDVVYIRQFEDDSPMPQAIAVTPAMFEDLINALHSPEGAFRTITKS